MEQEALRRLVTEAAREVRRGTSEDGVRGSHVLTLVNVILDTALEEEATDIHLEPMGGRLRIRMRVDGLLQEHPVQFPAELAPVIIARLKVMAGIDTAKRNRPQDGQIRYVHGGRTIDMRAAVLPVVDGERMVVRIMDAAERFLGCAELGFTPRNQEIFEQLIRRPTGLLLLCGPMNSGKTTTLYAALSALNDPSCHIMTLGDPSVSGASGGGSDLCCGTACSAPTGCAEDSARGDPRSGNRGDGRAHCAHRTCALFNAAYGGYGFGGLSHDRDGRASLFARGDSLGRDCPAARTARVYALPRRLYRAAGIARGNSAWRGLS